MSIRKNDNRFDQCRPSKRDQTIEFPPDLYVETVKRGTQYYGFYRTPWRSKPLPVRVNGMAHAFKSREEANLGAMKVLCTLFRNNTRGCNVTPMQRSKRRPFLMGANNERDGANFHCRSSGPIASHQWHSLVLV